MAIVTAFRFIASDVFFLSRCCFLYSDENYLFNKCILFLSRSPRRSVVFDKREQSIIRFRSIRSFQDTDWSIINDRQVITILADRDEWVSSQGKLSKTHNTLKFSKIDFVILV